MSAPGLIRQLRDLTRIGWEAGEALWLAGAGREGRTRQRRSGGEMGSDQACGLTANVPSCILTKLGSLWCGVLSKSRKEQAMSKPMVLKQPKINVVEQTPDAFLKQVSVNCDGGRPKGSPLFIVYTRTFHAPTGDTGQGGCCANRSHQARPRVPWPGDAGSCTRCGTEAGGQSPQVLSTHSYWLRVPGDSTCAGATRVVLRARSRAGAADRRGNDGAIEPLGLAVRRGVGTAEVAVHDDVGQEVSPGGEVGTGLDLQALAVAA